MVVTTRVASFTDARMSGSPGRRSVQKWIMARFPGAVAEGAEERAGGILSRTNSQPPLQSTARDQ